MGSESVRGKVGARRWRVMGSFKLTENRVKRLEKAGIRDIRSLWEILDALNLKGSVAVEWNWTTTGAETPAEPEGEKK